MIGELPESYDDWKMRTFESEDDDDMAHELGACGGDCPQCQRERSELRDDRNSFERAIDEQIELEQQESERDDNR